MAGFVCLATALAPDQAWACSCFVAPVCEALWSRDSSAESFFEATVVRIEPDLGPPIGPEGQRYPIHRVTLRDIRAHRGAPDTSVTTGAGGGDCGYRFEVGRRYLIHAWRNPDTGLLGTGICGFTRPLDEARETIAYLSSLAEPSAGGRAFGTVHLTGSSRWGGGANPPLANVRLLLSGPRSATTLSAPDGTYAFEGLPPGHYQLSVDVDGRPELAVPAPEPFAIPNAHACHRSYVNLAIDGTIEGQAVDDAGRPVEGVYLNLLLERPPADFPVSPSSSTMSDALGRFAFNELPPGRYLVGVNLMLGPRPDNPFAAAFLSDPSGAPTVIDLGLGALHQLPPLVVRRLTATTMVGQVLRGDGRPASGCAVSASPVVPGPFRVGMGMGATTGDDGRFAVEVLHGVTYRVRAANCTTRPVEVSRVGGDGVVQLVFDERR